MKYKEILANLCEYDLRNPDGKGNQYLWEGDFTKAEIADMKSKCKNCDNCFYGRTELAEALMAITPPPFTVKSLQHPERRNIAMKRRITPTGLG
jgi:hypothetical protein